MNQPSLHSMHTMNSLDNSQKKKRSFFPSLFFGNCCQVDERIETINKKSLQKPATTMHIRKASNKYEYITNGGSNFKLDLDLSFHDSEDNDLGDVISNGKIYKKDKLFILGNGSEKILAKITQVRLTRNTRHFSIDTRKSSNMDLETKFHIETNQEKSSQQHSQLYLKEEIFSLYDKGIKFTDWKEVTPEIIAEHIAKRLKCQIIIDALCGVGGNTIQFARFSNFVIGIDIDSEKTLWAKENAEIYQVDHKIDLLTGDFLKIKNLNSNIVYIAPSVKTPKNNQEFSLFNHIIPNMIDVTGKALEISYCLAFRLPNNIDFEELPSLFKKSFEKHETYDSILKDQISLNQFFIYSHVQAFKKIFNRDRSYLLWELFRFIYDLFWRLQLCKINKNIDPQEEYEMIYQFISHHETSEWPKKFPLATVKKVIEKVGMQKSLKYLSSLSALLCINESYSDSVFDSFIQLISGENILTEQDIKRLNSIELDKINRKNSLTPLSSNLAMHSNSLMSKKTVGSLTDINIENTLPTKIKNLTNDNEENSKKNPIGNNRTNNRDLKRSQNSLKKLESQFRMGQQKRYQDIEKKPTDLENKEEYKKSSDDGELALSSYSVPSGFFKDSYSDEIISPISDTNTIDNNLLENDKDNNNDDSVYHMTCDDDLMIFKEQENEIQSEKEITEEERLATNDISSCNQQVIKGFCLQKKLIITKIFLVEMSQIILDSFFQSIQKNKNLQQFMYNKKTQLSKDKIANNKAKLYKTRELI